MYLRPAQSQLFRALPELELPRGFSVRRARAIARRIPWPARKLVLGTLERVLAGARERT